MSKLKYSLTMKMDCRVTDVLSSGQRSQLASPFCLGLGQLIYSLLNSHLFFSGFMDTDHLSTLALLQALLYVVDDNFQ